MSLIEHILDLSTLPAERLSPQALGLARLSLLDWIACAIAGTDEPVAVKLRALAEAEGAGASPR